MVLQGGASRQCILTNWFLSQGEDVFPIPGTKRVKFLEENVAAFHINLTPEELKELEAAVPVHEVSPLAVMQ